MTKTLFSLLLVLLIAGHLSAQSVSTDSLQTTTVAWDSTFYDFGKVKQGMIVEYSFRFINTGPATLVIANVKSSCGCTLTDWPATVAPGETGNIKVKFNTAEKSGQHLKTIRVLANTNPPETLLQLGGEVKIPKRKRKSRG